MKIGARVLKTGLAITLSVFISKLLIPDNSAVMAGVAAVTATMPSVKQSFDVLTQRVIAFTLGGVVAVIALQTLGGSPIAVGIASVVTIIILNALKMEDVVSLSIITVVAVMLNTRENYYITAIYRVMDTFIGVLVSFLVNWLVYPPRYDRRFYETLTSTTSELIILTRAALRKNIEFSTLHQDLVSIKKQFVTITDLYALMRDEVSWNRSTRIQNMRRHVIYKHMVNSTEAVLHLLDTLHRYDHVYNDFDAELQTMIRRRVEVLLSGHEQILLKFDGRVIAHQVQFIRSSQESRERYLKTFFAHAWDELEEGQGLDADVNGVIHIMSAIYAYEEALYKLNSLIQVYRERTPVEAEEEYN